MGQSGDSGHTASQSCSQAHTPLLHPDNKTQPRLRPWSKTHPLTGKPRPSLGSRPSGCPDPTSSPTDSCRSACLYGGYSLLHVPRASCLPQGPSCPDSMAPLNFTSSKNSLTSLLKVTPLLDAFSILYGASKASSENSLRRGVARQETRNSLGKGSEVGEQQTAWGVATSPM